MWSFGRAKAKKNRESLDLIDDFDNPLLCKTNTERRETYDAN